MSLYINAYEKGILHGSIEFPKWKRVTKLTFQCVGEYVAYFEYKHAKKRIEYLSGWMTNYQEQS
jgi:hypothetical protein